MSRLIYCLKLAWLDLTRLWSTTQHHVVIVAGIVLPLLLLMGLKRGHVAELRKELVRSPTGRQVVIWPTRQDALLDQKTLDGLSEGLPDVELIIPESERVAEFFKSGPNTATENSGRDESGETFIFSTIYPTSPGDPILGQAGLDILRNSEKAIVVSEHLAKKLELAPGGKVGVRFTRTGANAKEQAVTELEVRGVLPQPNEKSAIAYVNVELLNLFERWVRGGGVEELAWPASRRPAVDRYAGYLMFVERPGSPTEEDLRTLVDRGLKVSKLEGGDETTLHGLIPEDKRERLDVWKITPSVAEEQPDARLSFSPTELEGLTSVDEMIIPWNKPLRLSEQAPLLVGITVPSRSRLRAEFLSHPGLAFKPGEDLNEIILRNLDGTAIDKPPEELMLQLKRGEPAHATLRLKVRTLATPEYTAVGNQDAAAAVASSLDEQAEPPEGDDTGIAGPGEAEGESTTSETLGIVPCQLLARLDAIEQTQAVFDELTQTIVQVPNPPRFGKARLYATDVDHVPQVVTELKSRGFAVLSESGRIAEIQQQDSSLQLLVWIVGLGVLLFGILTVFSVLLDSTDRKRGTIGILRVMGVSRLGVFLMVIIRAASIGLIAGFVSLLAGWLLGLFFGWPPPPEFSLLKNKPVMSILFHPVDLAIVLAGAVLCSCLGALLPAWRAAKVDPFDAIVEGRFK